MLCRELGLFAEAVVAINASKFKAVNNRDRNFTSTKLQRRMEEIESSIERYLVEMDSADRQELAVADSHAQDGHCNIKPSPLGRPEMIPSVAYLTRRHQLVPCAQECHILLLVYQIIKLVYHC